MIPNTLQQYITALIIVILLAFALAYGLQSALSQVNQATAEKPTRIKVSL